MEYGDPMCFPCSPKQPTGLASIGHYTQCGKCAGQRLLLDAWHTENERRKAYNHQQVLDADRLPVTEVPQLTFTGTKRLLRLIQPVGLTCHSELLRNRDSWTPYHPVELYDDEAEEISESTNTIVNIWNHLDTDLKVTYQRAAFRWPRSFAMESNKAAAASKQQHAMGGILDALFHIIDTSIIDKRINRAYVGHCLDNFGYVTSTHGDHHTFSRVAGLKVSNIRNDILSMIREDPGPGAAEVSFDEVPPSSPRKRRHTAGAQPPTNLAHNAQARVALFQVGNEQGGNFQGNSVDPLVSTPLVSTPLVGTRRQQNVQQNVQQSGQQNGQQNSNSSEDSEDDH